MSDTRSFTDINLDGFSDPSELYRHTLRFFFRHVGQYLDDPDISEIMINGPQEVYVERGGGLLLTDCRFPDDESLHASVKNLAQYVGRTLNEHTPRFDARLPDGSRVHVTLPPCSRNGICISIRKFSKVNFTVSDLVTRGSMSEEAAEFLKLCVIMEKNIMVSGGTGSGKTSLLNALSDFIPTSDRILVLEDSSELKLQKNHVLYYECVPGDKEGRGRVTIRDLFHSALRMRPTRVVIGEVRGGEALDMVQAMTSGHGGSMSTVHANTPGDALNRLETLALMGGLDLPLRAIRTQVASAIDVIIQTSRFRDGSRRLVEIAEVHGLDEHAQYQVNPIYQFVAEMGGDSSKVSGDMKWTKTKPSFASSVIERGYGNILTKAGYLIT
jgi:pilus assembly protein CpaF